jgi:hypothetical protein
MARGWLTKWILAAFAPLVMMLDCHASSTVVECERLQHWSCDCFGTCQSDDRSAINSADAATCLARLRQDFAQWQICASGLRPNGQRCDEACMLGWGACAFDVYRQAGLDAMNPCGTAN